VPWLRNDGKTTFSVPKEIFFKLRFCKGPGKHILPWRLLWSGVPWWMLHFPCVHRKAVDRYKESSQDIGCKNVGWETGGVCQSPTWTKPLLTKSSDEEATSLPCQQLQPMLQRAELTWEYFVLNAALRAAGAATGRYWREERREASSEKLSPACQQITTGLQRSYE